MFSYKAYAVVCLLGFGLLGSWFLVPTGENWADIQKRPEQARPEITLNDLADKETYVELEKYFGDRLPIKPSVVGAINSLVLESTGLSMSPLTTTGNIVPRLNEMSFSNVNLFFFQDFTAPCYRNLGLIQESVSAIERSTSEQNIESIFLVAPNKSTVLPPVESFWYSGLSRCARSGFADLTVLAQNSKFLSVVLPSKILELDSKEPYYTGDTHWKPVPAEALVNLLVQENFLPQLETLSMEPGFFEKGQDMLGLLAITEAQIVPNNTLAESLVSYEKHQLASGGTFLEFENSSGVSSGQRAVIVYDSFVWDAGLMDKIASQYESGYFLEWEEFDKIGELPKCDVLIFESVERLAYGRLESLQFSENLRKYLSKE